MVGLARVVLSGRERIIMIEARDLGLLATTLALKYEVRDEKPYFESDSQRQTLEGDARPRRAHHRYQARQFDPSKFEDRYQDSLVDLIRAKRAGKAAPGSAAAEDAEQCHQSDGALRRSVDAEIRPARNGQNVRKGA